MKGLLTGAMNHKNVFILVVLLIVAQRLLSKNLPAESRRMLGVIALAAHLL
jgi:DMSO/TMAO reductase YedYZ heme-binding membrane subunit